MIESKIMPDAPIQIKRPDVTRDIRLLARMTGQPLTEAVAEAVRAQIEAKKAAQQADYQQRYEAIMKIVEEFRKLPDVGPMLTDDDLYDEDGLPK